MKNTNVEKLVFLSASVALAMVLSFLESLIPPISQIPGVKLGLANVLTVFVLYKCGWWEACAVSFVRVLLAALLFGSFPSLIYSAFGAAFSLLMMIFAKMLLPLSPIGVSVLGAVAHNSGQILAAYILMGNGAIAYYLIPLIFSGTVSGIAIGVLGGIVMQRIKLKGMLK